MKGHGALATDGSFIVLFSRDHTGLFYSGMMGMHLSNAKNDDPCPFWLGVGCDPVAGFDPTQIADPCCGENIFSTHGRGIYLINQLMDEVKFERTDDGSRLVMIKFLKRPENQ